MNSICTGTVRHQRSSPVPHGFSYRIAMPLLDVDEVEAAVRQHPLWSLGGRTPVSFRRSDYFGDSDQPLADAIRDEVKDQLGTRPDGPVRMLAHVRTWGWNFNPIAVYWCLSPDESTVDAVLLDVTNTPWGESHAYVIPGSDISDATFDKELHVSPFLDMGYRYRLHLSSPNDGVVVRLANENVKTGDTDFVAEMVLDQQPFNRRSATAMLWRFPLMTLRVSIAIHWQALRLAAKGVRFQRHPNKQHAGSPTAPPTTQSPTR